MKNRNLIRWLLVWLFAVALTGIALVYQSKHGPTKPKKVELWLTDGKSYKFKLPRSHGGTTNCMIELEVPDIMITADVYFRKYPGNDAWEKIEMVRVSNKLAAFLPNQPPAGKLEYYILFHDGGKVLRVPSADQVVIRFRGEVPAWIILPHALLMFIAMLLSNVTLFLVIFNMKQFRLFSILTIAALFVGGLVLGPFVQKYAFGQFWTGFPNGMDLTDNKTLIACVFWTIAVIANLKNNNRFLTILASLVMLVIFSIPHSVKGSELDPETGKIKTGMVFPVSPCHHERYLLWQTA